MGFVNDYSNLLGQCAFSTGCDAMRLDEQYNGGQVVVFGVEAVGTLRIDFGDVEVPLRATYTYTDSRFRDAFEVADPTLGEVVRGDRLPYIPMHQAQLQLGVEHERAGGTLSGTYVGEMREQAGQGDDGERTERYVGLDANLWVRVHEQVRAYVRGENLLNQQPITSRRPFGARGNRPLSVWAGVKVDF
jgi:Fe(3+) dicitrate transport protein